MADFDARLPVRGTALDLTVEVANAAGTTINPAEEFAQGATTAGEKGPLVQGATTTAAPTYVTATTNPLSLDTAGNLRVLTGTGSTTAVTGSVTVVQPTGANLNVAVSNFPADADALAQGSTTTGQLGSLVMGAVTTAAPVYTTAQTSPLSLTTAGALRVDGSGVTQPVSIATGVNTFSYNAAIAVAAGASSTHTYTGGTGQKITAVTASASGMLKVDIQFGTTGGEVTIATFFTSASTQSFTFVFPDYLEITAAQSIKIVKTNREPVTAQDLYDSIQIVV